MLDLHERRLDMDQNGLKNGGRRVDIDKPSHTIPEPFPKPFQNHPASMSATVPKRGRGDDRQDRKTDLKEQYGPEWSRGRRAVGRRSWISASHGRIWTRMGRRATCAGELTVGSQQTLAGYGPELASGRGTLRERNTYARSVLFRANT